MFIKVAYTSVTSYQNPKDNGDGKKQKKKVKLLKLAMVKHSYMLFLFLYYEWFQMHHVFP